MRGGGGGFEWSGQEEGFGIRCRWAVGLSVCRSESPRVVGPSISRFQPRSKQGLPRRGLLGSTGDPSRLVTHYRFYIFGPKLVQQTVL